MKNFVLALALSCAAPITALADTTQDVTYIVGQTVNRTIFEAALQAQRPVLTSALQHEWAQRDIHVSDADAFFDVLIDEWIDTFTEIMQANTAEVYLDRFSAQEISDMAAFYRTKSGQALIRETPYLFQAGAKLGEQAGTQAFQQVRPRILKRLEEGGIEVGSQSTLDKLIDYFQ